MKISDFKKIAVLSNYSWAYTTSNIVKRLCPGGDITLITVNVEDVSKKHNFGMRVIELEGLSLKSVSLLAERIRSFKDMKFEAIVVDYGFSLSAILLIMGMKVKKIFIIDPDAKEMLRPVNRPGFAKLALKKMPYFFNKTLIHLSKVLRLDRSLGMPAELSLETTTVCNLRCKGCPTGLSQLDRPLIHISRDLFKDIIGYNRPNFKYFDVIYPFIFGEPLLNNDIFEYLKDLRRISSPYTRIELHTNGNIKNSREISRKLLETGVDLVSISLDGTNTEAYESFRRGGNFELVCEFINNLAIAKKEAGMLRPEIVVQMIVTKYSENQTEEFRGLKEKLGADRLIYKTFFHEFTELSDEEGYSLAPSRGGLLLDRAEKKKIIEKKKNMCGWAYRCISIMNNGNITPCCIDFNTTLLGGLSIRNSTIRKVWNSPRYRRFRRDMLSGRIPLCNKCFFS